MNPKIGNIILKLNNFNRNDTEHGTLIKELAIEIRKLTSNNNDLPNKFTELENNNDNLVSKLNLIDDRL